MGGFDWVWQSGLHAVGVKRTRLVSRSRVRTRTARARLFTCVIEPAGAHRHNAGSSLFETPDVSNRTAPVAWS